MKSPYVNSADAARLLCFTGEDGTPDVQRLHQWLDKWGAALGVEKFYRGRSVLLNREQLESALRRGPKGRG